MRRERLLRLLDVATTTPLTIISAPAGSGKTTLAAGWAAEAESSPAWVSLDTTDRDVRQFWVSVIAALQAIVPGCGDAAAVRRSGFAVLDAVGELLDELDADDHPPALLVIDDLQLVDDDDAIATSLSLFIEHMPHWLHLVLLSRREPRLSRDRLRAQGRLGEVHFAELRFSPEEARELMSRLASLMSDDQIRAAATRADGWAAGLQLAALAARSESARQEVESPLGGDELLIHDYVLHEVLAAETPDLISAFSDVAAVARFNPSLAVALTGRRDAAALFSHAEERGLFVTRVGPEHWFEIHSLVRATLVSELRISAPEHLIELHVRAARWFEQAGEVPLALEHWLLARRSRDALRLLAANHADLYDSGGESTILRAIAAIEYEPSSSDVESMIEFAWCHVLVNKRRFTELVDQATWLAKRSRPSKAMLARLTMLQSDAATINGSWVQGGELARSAIQVLGDEAWRDPYGRFGWNMIAREIALSERWEDDSDEVKDVTGALGRDPRRRRALDGTRALGLALAGWPIDAVRVAAGVSRVAAVSNMTILRGELRMAEAIAHREVGDHARALTELTALADTPAETMVFCRILAAIELIRAHLDVGDFEAARDALETAESLVESESFGIDGRDWLTQAAVQVASAVGDIEEATRLSMQIRDPFWHGLGVARGLLATGARAEALAVMTPVAPRCVRHEVVLELLRARATDDYNEALGYATVAVEQAAAAGLMQTVAADSTELLELVERAAWRVPSSWLDRFRRAASVRCERPTGPDPIEPLTERERDVLRFLPSRLTVREIADELYISVNTLKFHLKVIYRKLGVNSRAEASQAARRMALQRR